MQKNRHPTPATAPRIAAPIGPAKPAAGVTATRPATAPDTRPRIEVLHLNTSSTIIHASAAAAVAMKVLLMARAAPPVDSRAEPALKPNQPTQSMAPPTQVSVTLCGGIGSWR